MSPELNRRLAALAKARKQSVNGIVVDLLERAVGIDERRERLARYMTWTKSDQDEFEATLREQRRVDEKAWR